MRWDCTMRWYCVFLFLYGFAIQIKLTHSYFLGTRHTHSDAYTCACTPSSLQLLFDGSRVDSPPSARRSHRLFDSGPPIDPRTHHTRTPGFYGRYPRGPPVDLTGSSTAARPSTHPHRPQPPPPTRTPGFTVRYTPSPGGGAVFQPEQVHRENKYGEWLA